MEPLEPKPQTPNHTNPGPTAGYQAEGAGTERADPGGRPGCTQTKPYPFKGTPKGPSKSFLKGL